MQTELKIVQVESTAAILTTDLIATPNILEVVQWAKVHKQQLENAKKVYEEACNIIKTYMQSHETLVSPDGARLATWAQAGVRMQLDTEALKREFNDVYVTCCNEVSGNRPFLLK